MQSNRLRRQKMVCDASDVERAAQIEFVAEIPSMLCSLEALPVHLVEGEEEVAVVLLQDQAWPNLTPPSRDAAIVARRTTPVCPT